MTSPGLDGNTVKMVELNLPSNHFQLHHQATLHHWQNPWPTLFNIPTQN